MLRRFENHPQKYFCLWHLKLIAQIERFRSWRGNLLRVLLLFRIWDQSKNQAQRQSSHQEQVCPRWSVEGQNPLLLASPFSYSLGYFFSTFLTFKTFFVNISEAAIHPSPICSKSTMMYLLDLLWKLGSSKVKRETQIVVQNATEKYLKLKKWSALLWVLSLTLPGVPTSLGQELRKKI